jgi:hypothetical protein
MIKHKYGPRVGVGDIIKRRTFGIFSHYAIVRDVDTILGQPLTVYEYNGRNKMESRIKIASLDEFLTNSDTYQVEVYDKHKKLYTPEKIIERAQTNLGSNMGGYNVFYNNCEHWSKHIKLKNPTIFELNSLSYISITVICYIIIVLVCILGISIKGVINIIFYLCLSSLILFLSTNNNNKLIY